MNTSRMTPAELLRYADGLTGGWGPGLQPEELAVWLRSVANGEADLPLQEAIDQRLAEEEGAVWVSCSGCFEAGESGGMASLYHVHRVHGCHVGGGCAECNGRGIVLVHVGESA